MRLTGFDYSRPMFYMVTLKCLPGRQALSAVAEPGKCEMNPVTRAMVNAIRNFHCECPAIGSIECFTIMPDHLHLLIKIRDQLGAKLLGETPPASSPKAAPSPAPYPATPPASSPNAAACSPAPAPASPFKGYPQ